MTTIFAIMLSNGQVSIHLKTRIALFILLLVSRHLIQTLLTQEHVFKFLFNLFLKIRTKFSILHIDVHFYLLGMKFSILLYCKW